MVDHAYRNLGLSIHIEYTSTQIRDAYFTAAKRCHPDLVVSDSEKDIARAAQQFIRLSDAYDLIRKNDSVLSSSSSTTTTTTAATTESEQVLQSEEDAFRAACEQWLGLSAEVVEDSKRCPMFRQWLVNGGKSAVHWLNFLRINGGLTPRLRPLKLLESQESLSSSSRIRRPRRR